MQYEVMLKNILALSSFIMGVNGTLIFTVKHTKNGLAHLKNAPHGSRGLIKSF